MEMRPLGRTGVKVSPLCLGTMMFGGWGNSDHEDSVRIIHRALDAGINFVDTADVYSRGESEEIVGRALAGGGAARPPALRLRAAAVLAAREIEHDVLPTCQRYGMGVIPWSPLAGGWLSGAYRKGEELPQSHRAQRLPGRYDLSLPENQRKLEVVEQLAQLAQEAGITLIELALAFVIRHPAVTAAIIGPRTMEHLDSQLSAAEVTLSDEVLDRIDEITPPGVSVNPGDAGWFNPALEPDARRR